MANCEHGPHACMGCQIERIGELEEALIAIRMEVRNQAMLRDEYQEWG